MHESQIIRLKKLYVLVFGAYGGYDYLHWYNMQEEDALFLINYIQEQVALILAVWLRGDDSMFPTRCFEIDNLWIWLGNFMILLEEVGDFFRGDAVVWDEDKSLSFLRKLVFFY